MHNIAYTVPVTDMYSIMMSDVVFGMGVYEMYSPINPDGPLHCQVAVSLLTTAKISEWTS